MIAVTEASLEILILAQQYGPFTGLITLLKGLIIGAGGIGALIGLGFISVAGPNSDLHERGVKILGGSLLGVFVGLLASPIYGLFSTLIEGL